VLRERRVRRVRRERRVSTGATGPQPSFDRANWPPRPARLVAAALLLAFAGVLLGRGGIWRLGGALLVLDVAAQLLPWRYPRSPRSAVSLWAENLLYLTAPVGLLVAAVATGQPWLRALPAAPWWLAAVALAAALVWLGGLPLRALLSGDLAFLMPPTTRPHKATACVSMAAAPAGEEMLFRAPLLTVTGLGALPLGLLAAVAFVGRHHLPPGLHERTTGRVLATEVVAAAGLGLLTWASRSIYPALLAHYLNNAPSLWLEAGRRLEPAPRPAPAADPIPDLPSSGRS
jgi:hypothetical protein